MPAQILCTLQSGRKALEEDLEQLERDAQLVHSDISRDELVKGKHKIEEEISELDHCIAQISKIQDGKPAISGAASGLPTIKPGQLRGMPRLTAAVAAVLSFCDPPGRPVEVRWLVEQLNIGDFRVLMGRSKTPTKRRPVEPKDVRVMAANDITAKGGKIQEDGFAQGHSFRMNSKTDEIGLVMRDYESEAA